MKKIVRQQNYLKELIDTQNNRLLSKSALKCLIRSAFEPLLDNPENGVVLYRITDVTDIKGLLKRLEYSDIQSYDYSDNAGNILEKVWANTEFLCVLTHRYVAIFIWDMNTEDSNYVRYYSLYNSKYQSEALDIIVRNSKTDISEIVSKYNPDRRDNALLNASVRRLLENLEDATSDAVLNYAEKNAENLSGADYISQQTRVVAHEIKNQLSICDIYTEIINKHLNSSKIDIKSVKSSLVAINKALKMANNSLLDLKNNGKYNMQVVKIQEVIENACELGKVYLENKDIDLQIENGVNSNILVDVDKLTAAIINIIKNAAEAFSTEVSKNINGKYIKVKQEQNEDCVIVGISNNAEGIKEPEKVFNSGFTTKMSGNGLGLWICKKSIEEMGGVLELGRAGEDYTEFVITLKVAEE